MSHTLFCNKDCLSIVVTALNLPKLLHFDPLLSWRFGDIRRALASTRALRHHHPLCRNIIPRYTTTHSPCLGWVPIFLHIPVFSARFCRPLRPQRRNWRRAVLSIDKFVTSFALIRKMCLTSRILACRNTLRTWTLPLWT
jgi:hypothetical protein